MLIHPWDAATHFAVGGDTLLVHLTRPNKVWAARNARTLAG